MKKLLILFSVLVALATHHVFGQGLNELLESKVRSLTIVESEKANSILANEIERIALVEEDDWYANYYAALAYVETAYVSPKKQIDALCDRAEEFLIKAEKIQNNNPENLVLRAYLLSARINVSPMVRGAKLGVESKELLTKALEIDPSNPRALYVRGMGIYYTPAVFGGGKKKAKPYIEKAVAQFKKEKKEGLEPYWGAREAVKLYEMY